MPETVAVTETLTVQVAFAARLPPASEMTVPPATAVTTPAPQVVNAAGVAAIVTPAGNVSATVSALSGAAFADVLAIKIVRTDVPPEGIVVGKNALVSVTLGAGVKVPLPVDGFTFVTPSEGYDKPPAGIVLATAVLAAAVGEAPVPRIPAPGDR